MGRKTRNLENARQQELQAYVAKGDTCLRMRAQGYSYREIGEAVGLTPSGAYYAVRTALERTRKEASDEVRQMELERLDQLLVGVWDKATSGDTRAITATLQILDRRARYLGLDVPQMVDQKVEVTFIRDWRRSQDPQMQDGETVDLEDPNQ